MSDQNRNPSPDQHQESSFVTRREMARKIAYSAPAVLAVVPQAARAVVFLSGTEPTAASVVVGLPSAENDSTWERRDKGWKKDGYIGKDHGDKQHHREHEHHEKHHNNHDQGEDEGD
jgi:hypothetical protein